MVRAVDKADAMLTLSSIL